MSMSVSWNAAFTESTGIVVRYGEYDVVVVAAFDEVVVVAADVHLDLFHVGVAEMLVVTALQHPAHTHYRRVRMYQD